MFGASRLPGPDRPAKTRVWRTASGRHTGRNRWLGAGLILLGATVATTALLGPLLAGIIRYRTSATTLLAPAAGRIRRGLEELLVEAWLAQAPTGLSAEYLGLPLAARVSRHSGQGKNSSS